MLELQAESDRVALLKGGQVQVPLLLSVTLVTLHSLDKQFVLAH
jgi:hypothetical protein